METPYYICAQLCPTLCDLMDCSPPGSSAHGILQTRRLEWVAIPFGDLPRPGIELWSLALQADSLPSKPPKKPPSHSKSFHFREAPVIKNALFRGILTVSCL